jgi:hypothetical protein
VDEGLARAIVYFREELKNSGTSSDGQGRRAGPYNALGNYDKNAQG